MQEQLAALCLTIAIELLVAMPWRLTQLKGRTQWLRWAGLIAAASLLTHPVAWWMNTQLAAHLPFWERASVIEALVVLGEAWRLARAGRGSERQHGKLWLWASPDAHGLVVLR